MTNKVYMLRCSKSKCKGLYVKDMEQGYIEMTAINLEIANEMHHLEVESAYRLNKLLKKNNE